MRAITIENTQDEIIKQQINKCTYKERQKKHKERNVTGTLLKDHNPTSSFLVTTVRAVGSRLEADKTSLSWASFFSSVSARADSFFSNSRFLKLLFCCTSWIALTNLRYRSSLSSWVWKNKELFEKTFHSVGPSPFWRGTNIKQWCLIIQMRDRIKLPPPPSSQKSKTKLKQMHLAV